MSIQRVKLPAKSRRPREHKPRYIIIHTTQGPSTPENQYSGTINWFASGGTNSSTSWGSSADIVIGSKGEEAWFTDQQDRDYRHTRSNWSAGYGSGGGTYGADEYGISIETAQTAKGERPTQAALDRLVLRCIALCREYNIAPIRILYLSQRSDEPVLSGLVGHEDTANGRAYGKWDPNKKTFPWDWFIDQIRAGVGGGGQEDTVTYTVQPGDTLGEIAKRFGVTVAQLQEWNGIANRDLIAVGQQLRVALENEPEAGLSDEELVQLYEEQNKWDRDSLQRAKALTDGLIGAIAERDRRIAAIRGGA